MTKYMNIVYLPTISLKQICENMADTSNLIECDAYGGFSTETKRTRHPLFPFMKKRNTTYKDIEMTFRGRMKARFYRDFGLFPIKDILKYLTEEKIGDLAISKLVIINDDSELWKICESDSHFKANFKDEKNCVLTFKAFYRKEKKERELISKMMSWQLQNLKFKIRSLDLISIETFPDWKYKWNNNLIPSENQDTSFLKKAVRLCFPHNPKEFVRIRSYIEKKKGIWEYLQSNWL